MLAIQGAINIGNVESYLAKLCNEEVGPDLRIPTRLQDERAGGKAALIQFLLTWHARVSTGKLVTFIQSRAEASLQLKNLSEEEHGLCALLLASHVSTAHGDSLDQEAFSISRKRYLEIGSRIYLHGTQASITVAENVGPRALSSPFEGLAVIQDRSVRRQAFIRATTAAISNCLSPSSAKTLADNHRSYLADILYELFSNAEEWGSRDLDGAPLRRGLRGMLLKGHPKEQLVKTPLAAHAKGFPALERYLHNMEKDDQGDIRPFLEVSVFDNGIGLAQQFLRRSFQDGISLTDEYAAVQSCLGRHVSSARSPSRGIGLFLMMKLLSKVEGFLRIRTGRLSLFRDFKEDPYLLSEEAGARAGLLWQHTEFLRDFKSEEAAQPEACDFVSGALFTMWIPLKNLDTQRSLFE